MTTEEQSDDAVNEGVDLHEAGDLYGAVGRYLWAIQLNAFNAMAWFNLGVVREDQGRLADGSPLEAYRRSLVIDPSNADARYNYDRIAPSPWVPPQSEIPTPDWRTPEYMELLQASCVHAWPKPPPYDDTDNQAKVERLLIGSRRGRGHRWLTIVSDCWDCGRRSVSDLRTNRFRVRAWPLDIPWAIIYQVEP